MEYSSSENKMKDLQVVYLEDQLSIKIWNDAHYIWKNNEIIDPLNPQTEIQLTYYDKSYDKYAASLKNIKLPKLHRLKQI